MKRLLPFLLLPVTTLLAAEPEPLPEYKVSIEDFAQKVKDYIDTKKSGFRLNFFVDEVGQFGLDEFRHFIDGFALERFFRCLPG